jgi:hypothetical protein
MMGFGRKGELRFPFFIYIWCMIIISTLKKLLGFGPIGATSSLKKQEFPSAPYSEVKRDLQENVQFQDEVNEVSVEEVSAPGELKYVEPSMSPHKRRKLFGGSNK